MPIARLTAIPVALLCVAPAGLAAQDVPADLRRAIEQRARAISDADADAWARLTADVFAVVRPDGRLLGKPERIAELRQLTASPLPPPEQEWIQSFGDAVLRRIRVGDIWVTESWVRERGEWRVSSTQLTRVEAAGRGVAGAADRAAVEAAVHGHWAAINRGESDAVASHHTPDAVGFLTDIRPRVTFNSPEGVELLRARYQGARPDWTVRDLDIRLLGDAAVASFYLDGSITWPDGTVAQGPRRVTEVWVRDGDSWKEAHHHDDPLGRSPAAAGPPPPSSSHPGTSF